MTLTLTNAEARHLVLHLQGLTLPPHIKQTPQDLFSLIDQLGFVQVDSIQWVERAHHMILFARNQTYRPKHLKQMIEKDRLLFEGWTHDASIIPCKFYPHWHHRHQRQEARLRRNFVKWQGKGFLDHCDQLLELIANKGAVRSRDLERSARKGPQEMWQWHDGKAALEFLWRTGRLAISARDGFQKIYDLGERIIPTADFDARVEHDAFVDWACRSALQRLGFGSPADIARYWDLLKIAEVKEWLERQSENTIIEVQVEPADKSGVRHLIGRGDLKELLSDLPKLPTRLRALSPFDPVIRARGRLQWLFGFDYRIEIYVPEAKRKYGYYVYPLLEGGRLVGRIDMRANRKENVLQVKKLWLEKGVKYSQGRKERLAGELARQARLCGVENIEWLPGAQF